MWESESHLKPAPVFYQCKWFLNWSRPALFYHLSIISRWLTWTACGVAMFYNAGKNSLLEVFTHLSDSEKTTEDRSGYSCATLVTRRFCLEEACYQMKWWCVVNGVRICRRVLYLQETEGGLENNLHCIYEIRWNKASTVSLVQWSVHIARRCFLLIFVPVCCLLASRQSMRCDSRSCLLTAFSEFWPLRQVPPSTQMLMMICVLLLCSLG